MWQESLVIFSPGDTSQVSDQPAQIKQNTLNMLTSIRMILFVAQFLLQCVLSLNISAPLFKGAVCLKTQYLFDQVPSTTLTIITCSTVPEVLRGMCKMTRVLLHCALLLSISTLLLKVETLRKKLHKANILDLSYMQVICKQGETLLILIKD